MRGGAGHECGLPLSYTRHKHKADSGATNAWETLAQVHRCRSSGARQEVVRADVFEKQESPHTQTNNGQGVQGLNNTVHARINVMHYS